MCPNEPKSRLIVMKSRCFFRRCAPGIIYKMQQQIWEIRANSGKNYLTTRTNSSKKQCIFKTCKIGAKLETKFGQNAKTNSGKNDRTPPPLSRNRGPRTPIGPTRRAKGLGVFFMHIIINLLFTLFESVQNVCVCELILTPVHKCW